MARRAASKGWEGVVVRSLAQGLLETVRCVGGAAPLLARHQERLAQSWPAWFRGAPPDLAEVAGAAIAESRDGAQLVRIACLKSARSAAPRVEVESRALPPPRKRWRVALSASARVESIDERRHKQADRRWVEKLAVADVDETLVWDELHGLLEGTRSNLFALFGDALVTPPVACGLVPGVVRAQLLANAEALLLRVEERPLVASELVRCDALLLTGCGIGVAAVDECDRV